MNRLRLLLAATAALTALLLQATLVAPLSQPLAISLPAVLVACVAMVDGAGTGLAFGFVVGLLSDLGSAHPAGVLALAWMCVGLFCGTIATQHSLWRDAVAAGFACGAATLAATLLLVVVGSGGATAFGAVVDSVPATIGDAVLALALVPITRAFLRSERLRAPHPVFTDLAVSATYD